MEKTKRVVLLFEDKEERRAEFIQGFGGADENTDLRVIDKDAADKFNNELSQQTDEDTMSVEEALAAFIQSNYPDVDLLLVDHDLTGYNASISEPAVTAAGRILNLPVCRYHRAPTKNKISKINLWKSLGSIYAIELVDDEDIYITVNDIYDGFSDIKAKYIKLSDDDRMKGPAAALANILGYPGLHMRLSMYTNAVSIFNDLIETDNHGEEQERKIPTVTDRVPFVIGYWLYNVILRYPGVLLNAEAAKSYVDIGNFDEVQDAFNDALYTGPFGNVKKYWLRDILDEMLDQNDDVADFIKSKGVSVEISPCLCSIDSSLHAGYYDILNDKPISLEKSVGQLTWLPKGADLARVDTDSYENLAPLLNI